MEERPDDLVRESFVEFCVLLRGKEDRLVLVMMFGGERSQLLTHARIFIRPRGSHPHPAMFLEQRLECGYQAAARGFDVELLALLVKR